MQIVDIFRAKIVDVQADSLLVETTGTQRKVEAFLSLMGKFGVLEMTRTGPVAMRRGACCRDDAD
jgi:acetolactate synthase-1/3 small subunit